MTNLVVKKTSVLVIKTPDDDRYALVTNDEELARISIKILKERYDQGWYFEPVEPSLPLSNPLYHMTREMIDDLPDGVREEYAAKKDGLERSIALNKQAYLEDLGWYTTTVDLVTGNFQEQVMRKTRGGGPLAFSYLLSRDDYEYEGVRLERFEDLD